MKIYTVQSTVLPLISDNDHFMQVLAISCIFINQSSHSGTIQYIQYCSTELVVLVRAYSTWEQVKIKKNLKSTALVDCWQVTRLCLMSVLQLYPGAHCHNFIQVLIARLYFIHPVGIHFIHSQSPLTKCKTVESGRNDTVKWHWKFKNIEITLKK